MKKDTKKPNTTSRPFLATITLKDDKRKLKLNSPLYFQGVLETLPLNKHLTLWFDLKQPTRSQQQNSFMWLYLKIIENETGETSDNLHAFFKGKFLTTKIVEIFGQKVRQIKSTAKLNKAEFCDYLLEIEKMTDVPLPDTGDYNPQTYDSDIPKIDYPTNDIGEPTF